MEVRVVPLTVGFCFLAAAVFAADNGFIGTWKVNTAKSQFSPGPGPKELTVTFTEDGDRIKRTATGVDGEGKPIKQEGSIKWDGQDHAIPSGDGTPMTVAAKMVNNNSVEYTIKVNGKVTTKGRSVLSKDGKTATSTETGVNATGQKVRNVVVSEKL
jgi:hypothetical protein